MFKMTNSGKYHRNFIFVTIVDTQFVFYRATRLNNSGNSGIFCQLNTIREREESIACHHCSVQIKKE